MARNQLSPNSERIRRLFLHRQDVYTLRESAELLDMSRGTLIREASLDRPDAYRVGNRWRFTWRQLVYVALRRWSLGEIHAALGSEASAVLPHYLLYVPSRSRFRNTFFVRWRLLHRITKRQLINTFLASSATSQVRCHGRSRGAFRVIDGLTSFRAKSDLRRRVFGRLCLLASLRRGVQMVGAGVS